MYIFAKQIVLIIFQMMENNKKRWSIPKKLCPNAKKKRFNGVTTTIELFKTFLCKVEIDQKGSSSPKELCYNAKMNIVQVFPKTVNQQERLLLVQDFHFLPHRILIYKIRKFGKQHESLMIFDLNNCIMDYQCKLRMHAKTT